MIRRVGEILEFRSVQSTPRQSGSRKNCENRSVEVAQYAINRLIGRYPKFAYRCDKHADAIISEWATEFSGWSETDVDRVLEIFKKPNWVGVLNGCPELQHVLAAKFEIPQVVSCTPKFDEYVQFISRWERKLTLLLGKIKSPELALWDLLTDARSIRQAIDLGHLTKELVCGECGSFAVTIDRDLRQCRCWDHSYRKYHEAIARAKTQSAKNEQEGVVEARLDLPAAQVLLESRSLNVPT